MATNKQRHRERLDGASAADDILPLLRQLEAAERTAGAARLDADSGGECRRLRDSIFQKAEWVGSAERGRALEDKRCELDDLLEFLLKDRIAARSISLCKGPDFIISLGHKRIGIELTKGFAPPTTIPLEPEVEGTRRRKHASTPKQQEELQDQILRVAMEQHAQAGGAAMRLSVRFGHIPCGVSVADAANALAQRVPKTAMPDRTSLAATASWPCWLQEISAWHAVQTPEWEAERTRTVRAFEDCWDKVIAAKQKKLADYQQWKCDEYWLLVMVQPGQMKQVDPEREYPFDYDAIYLFPPRKDERVQKLRKKAANSE